MIDSVQLVLLVVIIVLTVLLVILGIQVYFILRDLRRTIEKTNKVLDNANVITDSVTGPLANVAGLIGGFKGASLITLARIAKNLLSRDRNESAHHHKE